MKRFLVSLLVFGIAFAQSNQSGFTGVLQSLFVPTVSLSDRFQDLRGYIDTKFPFSVASSLSSPSLDGSASPHTFNATAGILSISMAWFQPISTLLRAGFGLVIMVSTFWWLANAVVPRFKI